MGPQNELFHEAMENAGPVIEWVEQCCNRENLEPDGLSQGRAPRGNAQP